MIIIIILCTYIFTVDVLCSNTSSKINMDIRKFIISNPITPGNIFHKMIMATDTICTNLSYKCTSYLIRDTIIYGYTFLWILKIVDLAGIN